MSSLEDGRKENKASRHFHLTLSAKLPAKWVVPVEGIEFDLTCVEVQQWDK